VVITRFDNQPAARQFKNKLERRSIRVYTHRYTKGYPTDVETVVSEKGYGANEYIETNKPVVVVTGPGPNSGKLATCLSQLYHDYRRGRRSGYAKFETFPIWNLSLNHPVNVAYEAATADIKDFNQIDHFHLDAYNTHAVNYNRDMEVFPILKRIVEKITGGPAFYRSPTEMGVNRAGFGIVDDAVVREAALQEIIRRYFRYACEYRMGMVDQETVQRVQLLMEDLDTRPEDRPVVEASRSLLAEGRDRLAGSGGPAETAETAGRGAERDRVVCGAAIQLEGGSVVTGRNSPLMHAASSLILNAVKRLAGIPDDIHLLPSSIMESLGHFKQNILQGRDVSLDLEETLIALSISATVNPSAQAAVERLKQLRGCEAHMTHIPTPGDEAGMRKLGVNLTSDPNFASKNLFIS